MINALGQNVFVCSDCRTYQLIGTHNECPQVDENRRIHASFVAMLDAKPLADVGQGECANCGPVTTYVPDGATQAACWECGEPMRP